jgi:uncharacterized integral membrane protein
MTFAKRLTATWKRLRRRPVGESHGLGLWWTFTAALVATGAIIVAIVQNGRHVRVDFLAWHVKVSLIAVILTTALVAILLDEAGGLIWRSRRRARLGRRSELEQLRSQSSLEDEDKVSPPQIGD